MDGFDLEAACSVIARHGFRTVALQFPDQTAHLSVQCYLEMLRLLADPLVSLYIITDSSYGNSVDDISANHIDAQLLVYFGDDLNSSSSVPLLLLPWREHMLDDSFEMSAASLLDSLTAVPVIVCVDPSYHHHTLPILTRLAQQYSNVSLARLPKCADALNWSDSNALDRSVSASAVVLGGLYVPAESVTDKTVIFYIGVKTNQLISIQLKMAANLIKHYNPVTHTWSEVTGESTREFQQRYGGIARVQGAAVVGVVVGSMGLTAAVTQALTARLQRLILAAGKQYYTFVMGRLSESKLCNFPDINLFCLVGNDDVSLIKPKTFPFPVITPFELEIGLGCRPWTSSIEPSVIGLMAMAAAEDIEEMVELVRRKRAEEGDGDLPLENDDRASGSEVSAYGSREVDVFRSAAAVTFASKEYQGLKYDDDGQAPSTGIRTGLHGIAQSYSHMK